jgi:hypothetical protein
MPKRPTPLYSLPLLFRHVSHTCLFLNPEEIPDLAEFSEFDLVVCNPPYFPEKVASRVLDPAVLKYEPKLAYLTQDKDGLQGYREVLKSLQEANQGQGKAIPLPLSFVRTCQERWLCHLRSRKGYEQEGGQSCSEGRKQFFIGR